MRSFWPPAELEALLHAAPGLRVCHAAVGTGAQLAVARAMLRAEPPFAALRLHRLSVEQGHGLFGADAVLVLAADLAACTSIREVDLHSAALDGPAALDALVDAAIACRLHALRLGACHLSAASASALARLLGGGALAELEITDGGMDTLLRDAPAAAVLTNALHACSTLTALTLRNALWRDPVVATALLGALTGHASLRMLDLSHNFVSCEANQAAAGAALGALVRANAPALTELDVKGCFLGDIGLGTLFDALAANTHLRTLDCTHNTLSARRAAAGGVRQRLAAAAALQA
jgi:hypothetical protein